jgi:hypothetical protein
MQTQAPEFLLPVMMTSFVRFVERTGKKVCADYRYDPLAVKSFGAARGARGAAAGRPAALPMHYMWGALPATRPYLVGQILGGVTPRWPWYLPRRSR